MDDRPVNSPSLYFSYSPDPEALRELQGMFPNIPRSYIIRELDRANGVVSVAIDRLLLLAPDFMSNSENNSSLDTSPVARSDSSTLYNILKIVETEHYEDDKSINKDKSVNNKTVLTKKNWDSVDPKIRQRILIDKKKEMLMKARQSFLSKEKEKEQMD